VKEQKRQRGEHSFFNKVIYKFVRYFCNYLEVLYNCRGLLIPNPNLILIYIIGMIDFSNFGIIIVLYYNRLSNKLHASKYFLIFINLTMYKCTF
jgi:hypothetical protein